MCDAREHSVSLLLDYGIGMIILDQSEGSEEAFNSLRFRRDEDLSVTGVTSRTQNSGAGWKKAFGHQVRVVGDGGSARLLASLHPRLNYHFLRGIFHFFGGIKKDRGP